MNNQIEALNLTEEEKSILEKYKSILSGKPISITFEEMEKIKLLKEQLEPIQEQSASILNEVQQLHLEIDEKRSKIKELYESIDQRVIYLQNVPTSVSPRPVTRTTVHSDSSITIEAILEVLQTGAKGNAEILQALNLPNDKPGQNKAYSICKSSELLESVNRKWQIK